MKSLSVVLLFSIFYFGYVLFTQLLFGDNNLIEIKGQLTKKYNFVQTDTLKNKQLVKCAYLSFLMKNDKRLYVIKLDIDGVYQGFNVFGGVSKELENAGQISVWVKKSDLYKIRPKVYRILTDDVTVYEIINKPGNNKILFLLITLVAGFLAFTYFVLNYQQQILKSFKHLGFVLLLKPKKF